MDKPILLMIAMLMCIPESGTPFGSAIDLQWAEAKRLSHVETSAPRPLFCFGWEPRMRATEHGPERLLATYNEETRRIDVSLTPDEMATSGACVIRHELLHVLMGHDESAILAIQNCKPL